MLIICRESHIDIAEQKLKEDLVTKLGTAAGFAAGASKYGLLGGILGASTARRIMRDRIMFNKELKRAELYCSQIEDNVKQVQCMRQAMSKYHADLASQYAMIAKAAHDKGKNKQAAKYAKQARYNQILARLILNPTVSAHEARAQAKRMAKI